MLKVYFDASVRGKCTYIGVHCKELELNRTIVVPRALEAYDAEHLAFRVARKLTKNYHAYYFTDCRSLYVSLKDQFLHWIPRTENTIADNLSKQGAPATRLQAKADINIGHHIQKTATLEAKLNFAYSTIALDSNDRKFIELYKVGAVHTTPSKLLRRYLQTVLRREEKLPGVRPMLQKVTGLKNKELEPLLRRKK